MDFPLFDITDLVILASFWVCPGSLWGSFMTVSVHFSSDTASVLPEKGHEMKV